MAVGATRRARAPRHFDRAVRAAIGIVTARVHDQLGGLRGSTHLEGDRDENEAKSSQENPKRPRHET